jgi:adenylate cyclase
LQRLGQLLDRRPQPPGEHIHIDNLARYNAACAFCQLGEIDRAIDLLEICVQQMGNDMKLWMKNDSDLDPIRTHPRYQKLLDLAG